MVMFQPLGLWFQRPMWCYGRACLFHSHQQRGSDSFAFSTRPLGWQKSPHQRYQGTELIEFVELGPHFVFHREANQTASEAPQMIRSRWVATRSVSWLMCSSNNVAFFDDASLQKIGNIGKTHNVQKFREIWLSERNMTTATHLNPTCSEILTRFGTLSKWLCGVTKVVLWWINLVFPGFIWKSSFRASDVDFTHGTSPDIRLIQC